MSLKQTIEEINRFTRGWVAYFRHAECKRHLRELDGWIRRRLRCLGLKLCKRTITIVRFLRRLGVAETSAWLLGLSGKGWWRLSNSPQANAGMSVGWFEKQGLKSLIQRHGELNR